jgi:hypothetical protein
VKGGAVPTREDHRALASFLGGGADRPTLGLLYGRRRIGKSTLLVDEVSRRGGFYFEATRVAAPLQLERLGAALGERVGVGALALASWEDALAHLLRLGRAGPVPIVLDEFGYLIEADSSLPSVVAAAFGPGARVRRGQEGGQARMVLCGSALAMMRSLTAGQAPLRGRAGMELVMQPDDYRTAAQQLPAPADVDLAARVYAVIGGIVGYATDMVDFDLPSSSRDLGRWVVQRVLSPAATLHHEASTLLAEDPSLTGSSSMLQHSILGAIANGSVTAGSIANRTGRPVSNLAPALNRLVDAGFVSRYEDPVRGQRPTYRLDDPYLQFHYAVLEPHRAALRDQDLRVLWRTRLASVFNARVRGAVFEEQARTWVRRFASEKSVPGPRLHVGPSSFTAGNAEYELDVVVADGVDQLPAQRLVQAIGEAKAGQPMGTTHLARLEQARAAFGDRAAGAKLLLFAPSFRRGLTVLAASRDDVELVDLDRLYHGE